MTETLKKIIYLGPKGSYCEIAKNNFLKHLNMYSLEQEYFPTVKNIIKYTEKHPDTCGVIPIENSIEGVVRETMDNLLTVDDETLQITAETVIPVNHCLISKNSDINKIKKVISHPQALAQCQSYLQKTFGTNTEQIEKSSTSRAAQELTDLSDEYAAIANAANAKIYGLNVLAENINDEPDNKTRFVFISREKTQPTGFDKTSIAFATKNTAGALVKVLNVFDSMSINLLYIDSRPSKKNLGEYVFFLDFEGHIEEEKTKRVLDLIKLNTNYIKILGSYERKVIS